MIMGALIVTQLSFGVKAGAQELNESDYKNGTLPLLRSIKRKQIRSGHQNKKLEFLLLRMKLLN